ncbi:MAG: phospholipase D-like domain-containing protein, partial [Nitrospirota bacterium]|nr:phospholipase D-like domain-containing protein [Nitrospirota bacterium]
MIKVKRYLAIFIIALVVLGMTARAFCYEAEEARLLLRSEYFNVLHQTIQEAEDSVWVKMYYVAMKPDDPDNPVTILVNDLVDARKKGLDVRVILEDSLFDK